MNSLYKSRRAFGLAGLWLAGCLFSVPLLGQEEFDDQQLEYFESRVRPLLIKHCFECHGPDSSPLEGGLSLASRSDILEGGDTGAAIVPGSPDESLLIDSINYGDLYEMPPDTKLPDKEIQILTKWVEMGAPWPKESDHSTKRESEFNLEQRAAEHWCWQPIKRIKPPAVDSKWSSLPMDQFILERLNQAGLQPAKPADRRALIRRMTFDVTGLPPTPAEVDAFLADDSPDAVEKLIDRLLASPRFGEHWTRHWLDLVRYAETCGHEFDYPIPNAWRYRDYLIRALNDDIPYDQLIREHIAGDLLANPRRHAEEEYNESILGTGMWFLGEAVHGPVDVRADLAGRFDNQIDVMCKTFLGLTVACARCHDHKFDAISTQDYYALAGFLKSSRRQDAMLDPGRKIETAFASIRQQTAELDQLIGEYQQKIKAPSETNLKNYFAAAIGYLRENPDWHPGSAIVLQGESLSVVNSSGGVVEPQQLNPRGKTRWQNSKQLWWRDAKLKDTLELAVPYDGKEAAKFELFANFTTAADYGAAKISFNRTTLVTSRDFYTPQLATTGRVKLGKVRLKPGQNSLRFEIKAHHKRAIPRNMIGIDYLELVPQQEQMKGRKQAYINKLAARQGLNSKLLTRLIDAIKAAELNNPKHPLHTLQLVSNEKFALDQAVNRSRETVKRLAAQASQFAQETELFADFNNGLPDGWFETGFAFSTQQPTGRISAAGPWTRQAGTLHSGQYGRNFHGVLRSPTFTINHDQIHYRLRGENIRLRLIIEGYTMDIYNALLFNGMQVKADRVEHFDWIHQGGDLKNHHGLRAHIEIIDEGNGWVEIDEIRFSNKSSHRPVQNWLYEALAAAEPIDVSVETIGEAVATGLIGGLENPELGGPFTSWILDNQIGELFADEKQSISTSAVKANSGTRMLESRLHQMRKTLQAEIAKVPGPRYAMALTDGTGEDEHVYVRGNHKNLGQLAPRQFLSALDSQGETAPQESGSGRLTLAHTIASPTNPLTSRVIVNRIWHHLFGRGIVASVDNFGVLGIQPTHPELLDYLATDFTENGWSIKRTVRKILLTQTYQMSSQASDKAQEIDPENNLLHRANIKRLTGESIRDSMLMISGQLKEQMYGPPVPIHLTPFMQGRGRPRQGGPVDGDGRRSVYIAVRRNFLSPMMLAFDTPIPFNTTGRRNRSNVPSQALILMNDPLVIKLAEKWAERVVAQGGTAEQRIERIYESAFAKRPTEADQQSAIAFLQQQAAERGIAEDEIPQSVKLWQDYCHVIFNVKNFIYVH